MTSARAIARRWWQGWNDVPLRGKGLVVVAIPLAALLVAATTIFVVARDGDQADASVQQSLRVIAVIQRTTSLLTDAETGVRGYLLTGQPAYLEPFTQAGASLPASLDRLGVLVQDNPPRAERARLVKDLSEQALATLRALATRPAGASDASSAALLATGKAEMDALRAELSAMATGEQQVLADRTARARGLQQRGNVAVAVSFPIGLLGGVIAALLFTAGVARRADRLAENAGRLARRHPLLPAPTGGDEIGRLGRELASAGDLLASWERELRTTQAFLEHLIAGSPGIKCRLGLPDLRPSYISPNVTRLLGYTPEELLGDRALWHALAHPDDRGAGEHAFRQLLGDTARQVEFEHRYRHADGSYRWFYTVASRQEEEEPGTATSVLTYSLDITARKEAEAALQRARDELERRVQERTADLTHANEQLAQRQRELEHLNRELRAQAAELARRSSDLQQANRELAHKNDENEMFVYSVSHDLRSPLVNLQGFSQELVFVGDDLRAALTADDVPPALQQRALALVDGDMASSIRFIQTAVMRLSGIIDALLRLSRAGRLDYQRQPVDLNPIVDRIVTSLHGTITERGARVGVQALPPAYGDATALEQVFANLVSNALAYLDPRRPGCIDVGSIPSSDTTDGAPEGVTYFVRDNGLGIPAHARARLFQAFQRFHPTVTDGEGLGLALVRRIVERHGGRIWVESTEGEGSTFFVTLPAPPTADATSDERARVGQAG